MADNPARDIGRRTRRGIDSTLAALKSVRPGNPLERSRRIGIVGASRAGKSVLLTALLDHLRHFDPRRFRLQGDGLFGCRSMELDAFEELRIQEPPARFPYETFRAQLSETAVWPQKTRDAYQFRVRIRADDGPFGLRLPLALTFLDFPGERFADAAMAGRDFTEWSDIMERGLIATAGRHDAIQAFQEVSAARDATAESVTAAYKNLLARLIADYRVLVSPSVFSLGVDGGTPPRGARPEELARERLTGLDSARQFAPLDSAARERHPELAKRFEDYYAAYRAELIDPLYSALKRCDRLVFMANIPEILQSGTGALNDTSDLLQNVLSACLPGSGFLARSARLAGNRLIPWLMSDEWRPGGISKIALVASQADRIHPDDTDALKGLMQELAAPILRNLSRTGRIETFSCAAVRATERKDDRLVGTLTRAPVTDPGEREPIAYAVSRLPVSWPDDWEPAAFSFEDVLPRFSPNRRRPPRQVGLDTLFQFLLS